MGAYAVGFAGLLQVLVFSLFVGASSWEMQLSAWIATFHALHLLGSVPSVGRRTGAELEKSRGFTSRLLGAHHGRNAAAFVPA